MINEPSVETLIEALGNEEPASRYALCVVVAKRARQIIENAAAQNVKENPDHLKEIALACQEIANGKVVAVND